jgi:hypothetical protein
MVLTTVFGCKWDTHNDEVNMAPSFSVNLLSDYCQRDMTCSTSKLSNLLTPGALSLGVKRSGREADHSPLSSTDVKECVELYPHSLIRLNGVVLS